MLDGWIKLHRILLINPVWEKTTPEQKAVLVTLMLQCNYEDTMHQWKGKHKIIRSGQLITSPSKLARSAGVSLQNTRSALKKFETLNFITIDTSNEYSGGTLISIKNWEKYQVTDTPVQEVTRLLTRVGNKGLPEQELLTSDAEKQISKKAVVTDQPNKAPNKGFFDTLDKEVKKKRDSTAYLLQEQLIEQSKHNYAIELLENSNSIREYIPPSKRLSVKEISQVIVEVQKAKTDIFIDKKTKKENMGYKISCHNKLLAMRNLDEIQAYLLSIYNIYLDDNLKCHIVDNPYAEDAKLGKYERFKNKNKGETL